MLTLDNLIKIFGFPEKLILKDENNKEFKLDEFIKKDIGIIGMNCQTSSLKTNANIRKTSNYENNENNADKNSAIMENIAIELNANDDSIINGHESNENLNGANPDNSKTISTTNVFEKPGTTLNII